jgi:hypothetical protein
MSTYDVLLGELRQRDFTPQQANQLNTLVNNEYKVVYFAEINTATGAITIPTGATILLDQFPNGVDAFASEIDSNGQPTGIFPKTSLGVDVDVATFDALGNYTLTGTPSAFPIALIYVLKIKAIDYSNLNINNILEDERMDLTGRGTAGRLAFFQAENRVESIPAITPQRALVSDANGIPTASTVSDTTLGYLDATSSVQTQLDDSKPYIIDFTKTTSTGSSFNQTLIRSYLVPENTFKTGDVVKITLRVSRPGSGQTGAISYRIVFSMNNISYTSIGLSASIGATGNGQRMYRHFDIVNAVNNTEGLSASAQSVTDDINVPAGSFQYQVYSIDWTQQVWLGFTLTQTTTTDSSTIESVIIEKIRL